MTVLHDGGAHGTANGNHMTSDAQLLSAARGDPRAFRELYERYATPVHGYHLRRCGDPDAAHDLTAETFAQAWLARARYRDQAGGSAGPWLFGIARHVLAASVRRRRLERSACERLGILERLDRAPATAVPEERWLDEPADGAGPLDALPAGQREAVRLRVIDDLSYDDVADRLGTTPLGARVRVSRGLSTLRQRMTDEEHQ
jgi:RNA polymerase sigma factor (sigma-70 family)